MTVSPTAADASVLAVLVRLLLLPGRVLHHHMQWHQPLADRQRKRKEGQRLSPSPGLSGPPPLV